MKPVLEIDFESRSRTDIRKAGAGRYAADESTQILCVCWAKDNGQVYGSLGEEIPPIFFQAIKEGWTFSAFNAIFEQLIWRYRWPAIPVPQFICTRSLVAAHNLPQSLDRACKALHIGYAKDIEGKRLINAYSVPRKDGTFNELKGEDQKKMLQYCAKDVLLSRRIRQRLPSLLPQEQEVYDWTVKANIRGICIDTDLAQRAQNIASELERAGNKELAEATGNRIFSVSQIQRIKTYLNSEFGIETESLDKETIEEILLQKDLPDTARVVLQIRQDLAQSSVKKFARAASSVCADGKVRDALIYHGAGQTGRWAGQVIQFQNLPRSVVKDPETALKLIKIGDADLFNVCYAQPMQALSSCLRSLIVPEEGTMFAVVDYNAIEARGLVWAAGQEDAIYDFHNGVDRYLKMAEAIYRRKGLNKKDHAKERFLGKTATLGCFSADTLVLTNNGWKRIVEVLVTDTVWDGEEWVKHKGVICQGHKKTLHAWGVDATPEHEILTEHGWREWQEVITNPSLSQSAFVKGLLPLSNGSSISLLLGNRLDGTLSSDVTVGGKGGSIEATSKLKGQHGVMGALRYPPTQNGIGRTNPFSQMKNTGLAYLIEFHRVSQDAITQRVRCIRAMADGVSGFLNLGVQIGFPSLNISYPFLGGKTLQDKSTGLITTKDTSRGIFDLPPSRKIIRTDVVSAGSKKRLPVYDIAFAGPRSRFTIATNAGSLIVHNCGYQMGHIKFQATCEAYGIDLGEKTEYVEKTNKEGKITRTYYAPLAKAAVDAYRSEHAQVIQFWYDMQNAATKCVLTQESTVCGKFSFHREREFLYMQLPSGRRIAYHKPGVDTDGLFYYAEDSQTNQYVKKRTYGGKLVENAVQALSRDVLAHGILNLEKAGFPVLMTIHDENIVSIKSKEQIEEVSRIMCELPAWAKGFPVAAEGFVCSRYRKG